VGERAARKAREASDATDLEPGRYEVILEPNCVADILSFLLVYGFNAKSVEEGRSFAQVGEPQFDPSVNLRDDVTAAETIGIPFDVEGTPKQPLDLVRDGTTAGLLQTRRTAHAAGPGAESTGHAVEGGAAYGALGANLTLDAGDRVSADLIAGVQRGVLVTDFWYTRILDPRTQVVTGLTRNGVWLIEDGRIARPVTNFRFTQSFLDAIGPGAVRGIGSDSTLIVGGWDSIYLVPSLHLASWNFTGGAKG
jgi:predicted Zn-dependent protease